jgi:pimeloyl-ACP methyl ester carboxylesterase
LRLHYAEAGSGDPLVLLHGWPQHWWAWREVIVPLSGRFRVICPDVRGLGWSEGGPGGYSLRRLAADLMSLLDVLGIERTRLVGYDWGTAVGYRACLDWPERFERYLALGGLTPWSSSGAPLRLWLRPWHIPVLGLASARARTTLAVAGNSLRSWRHVGRCTPEEERVYCDRLREPASLHATHAYYRNVLLHEFPHYALRYREMRLGVPTLHLNGDRDPLTRGVPDSYRRYAPNMELELIPDCGYFIAEEHPAWLLGRMAGFFGSAEGAVSVMTVSPKQ